MNLNFDKIPKVVLNLKRREDRLVKFKEEMDFMGWDYDVFEAIDTGSYIGCALSHVEIAKKFLEKKDEDFLLVMEDDLFFMPYAKKVLMDCQNELNKIDWEFFHFGPSIHRPLKKYNDVLIDLNNLPPKDIDRHRGIFGTTSFVLTKKSAEVISNWDTNLYIENHRHIIPIDEYFDKILYKKVRSFCPYWLITTQQNDFSDINKTFDNNHYLLTYNWNVYLPHKIPTQMLDFNYCKNLRYEKN